MTDDELRNFVIEFRRGLLDALRVPLLHALCAAERPAHDTWRAEYAG